MTLSDLIGAIAGLVIVGFLFFRVIPAMLARNLRGKRPPGV